MAPVKVIPLACPDCGQNLLGLRFDRVFFCNQCRQGLLPAETQNNWERFPMSFAGSNFPHLKPAFHLPVWEVRIVGTGTPTSTSQEVALRWLSRKRSVWVPGYSAFRQSYYGDIGLLYTEKDIQLDPLSRPPPGAFLAGCAKTVPEVIRYVELMVTLMVDRRSDVTGMELSIETRDARIWGIPFIEHEDKAVELVTGKDVPSFSIDDMADILAIARRRR